MKGITLPSFRDLADERLTADREETKYLIPPVRWQVLAAELSSRLPGHRFTGEGANRLPDPHHYVTTIYFDTPSRALFRTAAATPDRNIKVRAKEYYDLHPSLAEIATDPDQIVHYQPWLWFEVKRRDGARTSKRRFRLPKRDVAQFFAEGRVTPEALELTEGAENLGEVVETCQRFGEPLSAVCSGQLPAPLVAVRTKRVARDVRSRLASFAPPARSVGAPPGAGAQRAGRAGRQERAAILEVKRPGRAAGMAERLAGSDRRPPIRSASS
jgi:hypothetical protein